MKTGTLPLAEAIKLAREQAGLTQKELADKIGLSYRSVQEYEAGNQSPTRHLSKIEQATGKPDGWLSDLVDPYSRLGEIDERLERIEQDVRDILGLLRQR